MFTRMGAALAGTSAAYAAYNVHQKRVTWGAGHSYNKRFCVGKVDEFGTPKEYMSRMARQPNGLFPMTRINGTFDGPDSRLYLQFAAEKPNEVIVVDQTETSVLLKTGDHIFKGTAEHSLSEQDGYLYYSVGGKGVENEPLAHQFGNLFFADLGWRLLLPMPVGRQEALTHALNSLNDPYA